MLDSEWEQAQTWITKTLADRGTPAIGRPEIERDRPWARVAKVPVDGGLVWFKRNNFCSRYEGALAELLAEVAPEHVIAPIAIDRERGWQLLPDGGHTLRSLTEDTFHERHWVDLLTAYADLQRRVAPHAEQMLAVGVPDIRPQRLPEIFAALLDDSYVTANLSPESMTGLQEWQPRIEAMCDRLIASGIAASVQHDDLHPSNVFAAADGRLKVFDFGDASVAHPFGSMLVALRVVHRDAKVEHGDPVLYRLRDIYLEAWGEPAELEDVCQDAIVVTKISKALSYQRSLAGADEAVLAEYGESIYGWLEELLGPDVL